MKRVILFIISCLVLYACDRSVESKKGNFSVDKKIIPGNDITSISDLPDSLQPDTFYLKDMPKPQEIEVPTTVGGFWTDKKRSGEIVKTSLEPPTITLVDVLRDGDGNIVLDSNNNPFILGEGGSSDFTNFTTDQGLSSDNILRVLTDKNGNLWFASNGNGVSKYDGKSFTIFTTENGLAGNIVTAIYEDRNGIIWIGTDGGGVSRYDGTGFFNYTIDDGLAGNIINTILQDSEGNLWFGTYGKGISRFDGKKFKNFNKTHGLAGDFIFTMIEDDHKNILIGTRDNGISIYNGKSFTNLNMENGLPNNKISSFCKDKSGKVWIGTYGGGLSCYNGRTFKNYTLKDGLAGNRILSLYYDSKGIIWIGTNLTGLCRYDGNSIKTFTSKQGISDEEINGITEDSEGNIWICTSRNGIYCYKGNAVTFFTKLNGLSSDVVWSIFNDKKGNMWFGTSDEGVNKYDGKFFTNYKTNQGLALNFVLSIAEDIDGKMYFGTYGGGLSCFDGKKFTNYRMSQGLANNSIWCIYKDSKGKLWFGTNGGGISCFDGKSFINYSTKQGLADNVVSSITEDGYGNMWFVTESNGISVFNHETFLTINTDLGLPDNRAHFILKDKLGNIWVDTEKGVCRLSKGQTSKIAYFLNSHKSDSKKNKLSLEIKFDKLTTEGGLSSNSICGLTEDSKGNIMIGTSKGITVIPSKYSNKPFSAIKSYVEIFNQTTGYPLKDINFGAMFCDKNGVVWIGAGGKESALVRFDYSKIKKDNSPPVTYIKQIKANHEILNWYRLKSKGIQNNKKDSAVMLFQDFLAFGKRLNEHENSDFLKKFDDISISGISANCVLPEGLELPYKKNKITIEFSAIETSNPQTVRYRYMLQGYTNEWSEPTSQNIAVFGNIYEGNYTFKVVSNVLNGVWGKPQIFKFTVLPPWYRTWWAYITYLVVVILSISFLIRRRLSTLKKINIKLESKVQERTDELVKKNAFIEKQKSEVEYQKSKIEEALTHLKQSQEQLIQIENEKNIAIEKSRIARDMHDEIGSGLTQISMLTQILKSKSGENQNSIELDKLSLKTRELIQNMSQIIWAMNNDNDNLENLLGYLRKFCTDFFENSQINCTVEFSKVKLNLNLSQSVKRNLLLVIKETFHNILKHSEANSVKVEVEMNDKLIISIHENGNGFDIKNLRTFGNGLKNMKKRMDEIGGIIEINSTPGRGSLTKLMLNIK